MASVKALRCSNCQAPLRLAPDATQVRCEYCGVESVIRQARRPWQASVAEPVGGGHAPASRRPVWVALGVALALGFASAMIPFLMRTQTAEPRPPVAAATTAAASGENISWQSGSAKLCSLRGDGNEDLVGLFRLYEDGETRLYAGGFRGEDLSELWRAGPFGTSDDPYHYTRVACAGSSVIVADFRGTLHAFDAESGADRWSLSLSDRAERMCAGRDSRELFVEMADEAHRLVDVELGKAEAAEHPTWCAPRDTPGIDRCGMLENFRDGHARATCRRLSTGSRDSDGFRGEYALEEGGARVLVGHKHPGTRTPMAAGVRDGEIAWTKVIPKGELAQAQEGAPHTFDLADGKLVVLYETGDEVRLAALDAETGGRLWDEPARGDATGGGGTPMTISPCRVYVPLFAELRVFAADTGAYLGGVGRDVSGPGGEPCSLAKPEAEPDPAGAGERGGAASSAERQPRGEPRRERQPPPDSRPETPDRQAVVRTLSGLEFPDCKGWGTLTYGIRIDPDGSARTTSLGPMRARGPASGCVRSAIEGLRFPESREGLELKHEFTIPEP